MRTHVAQLRWFVLTLMLALLYPGVVRAQFDGPTPPPSYGVNVRHPITTDPAILYPANQELKLLPADVVVVRVLDVLPELTFTTRVSLDGSISVPYAGAIHVGGLTISAAEALVSQRLQEAQVYNNAQVSIQITDAPDHVATVVGEAHAAVPVLGSRRLLDVIGAAGGLPASASNVVSIHRPGLKDPIVLDLGNDPSVSNSANVPVFAGDTITIGRVGRYYVVGAVKNSIAVDLSGSTPATALQALAHANGALFDARLNDAKLIRTQGTQRFVIPVHLSDIEHGKAADPVLQTDDILLIPSDPIRAAIRNGGIGTALAIAVTLTYFK